MKIDRIRQNFDGKWYADIKNVVSLEIKENQALFLIKRYDLTEVNFNVWELINN